MSTSIINFNDKKIKKINFYNKNKKIFDISDIDISKILVSKKEQYGKHNSFKYFIGYNDNDVIRPLYLFISQTTGYINKFDKNKITSLMIKDIQFLKNYNKIWKEIEKLMKIDFNTKTTYGDGDSKYIKPRMKTYKDSITTNFYNKKVPHKCFNNNFRFLYYAYEKYHPQTFLEECKYAKEKIKTNNYIDEEFDSDSDNDNYSDNDVDLEV